MPRDWPPLTVWWAAGLLTLPPLAGGAWAVANGDSPAEAGVTGLIGLLVAAGLVGGWRGAYVAAVGLGVLATAGGGLVLAFAGLAGLLWPALLPRLVWPLVLGLTLLVALQWPATRRWCGRLPAAASGDDA